MATTQNTFTGNGSTVLFSFTFPYLDSTDILVSVNGTLTTAYTLANATTIQFTTAPANGAAIRIFRVTDDATLAATFYPGSSIRSQDLNENFTQNLYATQESNRDATTAISTANGAVTTANTALSNSTAATSTANTASANASAAVSTANTANSNASAAVSTANTASSNASAAVSTANAAAVDAATAISTANGAVSTANAATSTANTALSNSTAAVSTANTASSNASAAVSTANTASSNASTAVSTANSALSTANTALSNSSTAISTANAASAAVASAVIYQPVVDLTALGLLTPADGDFFELQDSTGADTDPDITGVPGGLVGAPGLTFRLRYDDPPQEFVFLGYFANDSETRYLKFSGGTVTGEILIGSAGSLVFEGATDDAFETTLAVADATADRTLTLPNVTGTLVSTGDTGTVTSTMLLDGTIVNADINASAAIVDTKLATISTAGKVSGTAITSGDIATSGDLEITSTTPIVRLAESDGTATHSQTAIVRNSDQLLLQTRSSTGVLLSNDYLIPADASGATEHQWRIANTEKARLDSAGLTVVNDLTISDKIIHAGDTNTAIRFPAADTVSVETAGSERLRITSAGLVGIGIGISVPTAQLHVANVGTNDSFIVEDSGSDATPFRIDSSGGVFTGSRLVVGAQETYNDGAAAIGIAQLNGGGLNNSRIFSHIHWGGSPRFRHCSTPSTTLGTHTISALSNVIGAHEFYASDGVNFIPSASIQSTVDATPSVGVVPGNLTFSTAPAGTLTERLRIDSSGRLLVGTSSARNIGAGFQAAIGSQLFIEQTSAGLTPATFALNRNDTNGPRVVLGKSRGTALGSNTIVQSGDELGRFDFAGADGTDLETVAAEIKAVVDGTPGANDMPGRLVFSTTADGASSPTERMRINSAGNIITTGTFVDPAITGTILEDVFTITDGAAFEVDPANGSIQLITLGASRTPKATNFAAGESITLMVNDGTAYTLTWTDATWGGGGVIWRGGTAPTLATTGYSVIQFWKVASQVYGASVGDVA
jgi:hypothetical protein